MELYHTCFENQELNFHDWQEVFLDGDVIFTDEPVFWKAKLWKELLSVRFPLCENLITNLLIVMSPVYEQFYRFFGISNWWYFCGKKTDFSFVWKENMLLLFLKLIQLANQWVLISVVSTGKSLFYRGTKEKNNASFLLKITSMSFYYRK